MATTRCPCGRNGGILKKLLQVLVAAVMFLALSASAAPALSEDTLDGQPIWTIGSCADLSEPWTPLEGILIIAADIVCEERRVSCVNL